MKSTNEYIQTVKGGGTAMKRYGEDQTVVGSKDSLKGEKREIRLLRGGKDARTHSFNLQFRKRRQRKKAAERTFFSLGKSW